MQTWIDQAVAGDDQDIPLSARDDVVALFERDDVEGKLRVFARMGRQINERVAVPVRVVRAAAPANPELAALLAENEARRQSDFSAAVANLTFDTSLPSGLTTERAAELVAALCSVDLYRSLVLEAGWAPEEYEAQLVRLLASALGLGSSQ